MGRMKGRGNYPQEFKIRVAAEASADGTSVASVARRHGLNANMVFQWRKDRRYAPCAAEVLFLPVDVVEGRGGADRIDVPDPPVEVGCLEISVGRVRIVARGNFDPERLGRLLAVLPT